MFELGILCIILLAAGYWATLFIMGRRDDVLHGKFVQPDPVAAEPQLGEPRPRQAVPPPLPAPRADAKALKALLETIKRDLKDAAQI